MKKTDHLLPVLALLLAGWLGFFLMEPKVPFTETSDARYCEIAWETVQYGDWIVPRQNRMAHITKPPLTYWLVAAGNKLFGVNEAGSRFFSGLFGILLALLTYAILLMTQESRHVALAGGLILTTTPLVTASARIVTTDIFLVVFMTLSMAAWLQHRRRPGPVARWIFWLGLGLSGMAKGPIGPLLVFGILLVHLGLTRNLSQLKTLFAPAPVAVGILLMAWWPILICLTVKGSFHYLVIGQLLSRVESTGFGHPHPFWYFLAWFPVSILPWMPLLGIGIAHAWRSRSDTDRLLLVWLLFPLVFFSIPANKLILYVLPAVVPAAVFSARAAFTPAGKHWFPIWSVVAASLSASLPTVSRLAPTEALALWRICVVLLVGALVTVWGRRHAMVGIVGKSGTVLGLTLVVIHLLGQSPEVYLNTSKTVAAPIRIMTAHRPVTLLSDGLMNRGLTLYTGLHPYENTVDREVLPAEKAASRLIVRPGQTADFIRRHPETILIRKSRDPRPLPMPMIPVFRGHRYSLFVPIPKKPATR